MAERKNVPNLEAKATDGNPVFTPKLWLERFRQFSKREHKINIALLIKEEEITPNCWTGKEQAIQDFTWGVGPEAVYQITRAEYKTEPDTVNIKDLIRLFTEFYMPKRNTYHNRGDFFWTKHTGEKGPEQFWRRLIEIEEECNLNTISAEELLISKYMTAITDKKLRDKIMEDTRIEKINRANKTEYVRDEEQKEHNTRNSDIIKRKTSNQRRTNQRMERFGTRPKNKNFNSRPCRYCGFKLVTTAQMPRI